MSKKGREKRMTFVGLQNKQKDVYEPLIEHFKEETKGDWDKLWFEPRDYNRYLAGLMIPKVFPYYQACNKKVIYMGQDTYEWVDFDSVYNDTVANYLKKNNDAFPKSLDDLAERWGNPYHFWDYVCKLQLAIHGSPSSLNSLSEADRDIISGIGWGNLNPLEKDSTIWKYGEDFCKLFDWSIYYHLFERAKEISKVKYLIEAYHPDLIINLCWDFNENLFFDGVEYEYCSGNSLDGFIACYLLKDSNTQVIWSRHPNNLRFMSITPDEIIKQIVERIV